MWLEECFKRLIAVGKRDRVALKVVVGEQCMHLRGPNTAREIRERKRTKQDRREIEERESMRRLRSDENDGKKEKRERWRE